MEEIEPPTKFGESSSWVWPWLECGHEIPIPDDFGCQCGGERVPLKRKYPQFRIVGGKSVKDPIDWIAYIRLVQDSVADFCTGSLINARYVLSAGHCACMAQIAENPCSELDGTLVVNYDPAQVSMEVFLDVADRSKIQGQFGIKVIGVKLHPKYELSSENPSFDLALFKLAQEARHSPICLPHSGHFVEPKAATVAGWGFQYKDCQTNLSGPERFATCHTNWHYKDQVHGQCEKAIEPPSHPLCEEFYERVSHSQIQPVGPVVIKGESGTIDCPLNRPPGKRYFGWCATCQHEELV
eukprot:snap_masked-scaffold689_size110969-processed-gene-0.17 protein:Tk07322 transcript:snap_masked-scaffold689_size110969-processed-gene-0.17-mRNA-1 annotation:"GH13131"